MNVELTGRHYEVDSQIRDYAHKKLTKLDKFLEDPVEVHLILEQQKLRQIAELLVSHRHGSIKASEEAEDMRDAVFSVISKVEKQARRSRKKFMDRRRRAQRQLESDQQWPMEVLQGDSLGAEEGPRVIKKTHLPIKPMTLDEASMHLERSKNEFFVFLDSATDRVSVLYRRKDQHYGLIAPKV